MLALLQATQRTAQSLMRTYPTVHLLSSTHAAPRTSSLAVKGMPFESLRIAARFFASRPVISTAVCAGTVGVGCWAAYSQAHPGAMLSSLTRANLSRLHATESSKEATASSHENNLKFSSGAAMIPHPSKEDKGGEDAYFICESGLCFGVADGVGGWAEIGIDPGLYSRELMSHAKTAAALATATDASSQGTVLSFGPSTPQRILETAHSNTMARGSCTACILCLYNSTLYASNLGDSGFLVVRQGDLLFMSPQQQHEFNFPYQLGSADSMADSPSAAQTFSIAVQPGDVVVAATDGLFDNVYPDEAAAMVAVARHNGDSPGAVAALLAQFARTRAADPAHLSPFAYGAQQLGFRYFGGKMDDITVVCAYIEDAPCEGRTCS